MDCHVNQVLAVIAGDLGVAVEAGKGLRCACQVGTTYWHECWAKAKMAALMDRLERDFSR